MNPRHQCPSCHYRLSPLAAECPVCGLSLTHQALPRPLLFQASALQQTHRPEARKQAISAPALGRVTPVFLADPEHTVGTLEEPSTTLPLPPAQPSLAIEAVETSFWPLVRMEFIEFLLLAAINGLFCLLAGALSRAPIGRVYGDLWPFILPVHLGLSWAFVMVPMALTGQSPMMGSQGLLLDTGQPERRLAFSLFHLLSVSLFPVSFLCLVLTPDHRTLAELLTGQEILARPMPRMR